MSEKNAVQCNNLITKELQSNNDHVQRGDSNGQMMYTVVGIIVHRYGQRVSTDAQKCGPVITEKLCAALGCTPQQCNSKRKREVRTA